jgi:hypothetical protein
LKIVILSLILFVVMIVHVVLALRAYRREWHLLGSFLMSFATFLTYILSLKFYRVFIAAAQ